MARKKKILQETARNLIAHITPCSFVAEQYRTLRTNIIFFSPDTEVRTIVITSAAPSEGMSTTSAKQAVILRKNTAEKAIR